MQARPILGFDAAKLLASFGILVSIAGVLAASPIVVVLGIVGWLLGVYALSQHYGSRSIFDYAVYAGVIGMVAGVVGAVAVVGALIGGAGIFSFVIGLVVFWLLMVAAAWFLRRHLDELARSTGLDRLERAGRYILVGALLSIILVGLVIALVGLVMVVIGILELRPPPGAPGQASTLET